MSSIDQCLNHLRRRERLLSTAWGVARWLGTCGVVLLLACLLDWTIDRWRETPWGLRWLMFAGQSLLWLIAGAVLVARPLLRRFSATQVATWLEGWDRTLDHRLVAAVELNQAGARTDGMSLAMIEHLTKQADQQVNTIEVTQVLDGRRWRWSLLLLAGLAALFLGAALFWPIPTLIARQFLSASSIPRNVILTNLTPAVWPNGDEVLLQVAVQSRRGNVDEGEQGHVTIHPEGRATEVYPLVVGSANTGGGGRVATARVPASTVGFSFQAWLRDGRLAEPASLRFEPRPVVGKIEAWVQLPEYCGRRPDGQPYATAQPRGEVIGLAGSQVLLAITAQKPLQQAAILLLGDKDVIRRRIAASITAPGDTATARFDLQPEEIGYRVVVEDEHGFSNSEPPRRSLRIIPDEPPHVVLLPEHFTARVGQPLSAETEVEGKPIPVTARGGKIRVAYVCQDSYGLAHSQLIYRILRKDNLDEPGPWLRLPLQEVQAAADVGPFDPRQGVFRRTGLDDQIEFHAEPAADPMASPGRGEGGGRFDFHTGTLGLNVGDQLEYAVEVFDLNPDPNHLPGRSEIRRKQVVTPSELLEWLMRKADHENRIRDLERKQREVPKAER